MADHYESGASEPIEGASRSLEELTPQDVLEAQVSPSRPEWMVTRFPVDMEEFRAMSLAARDAQLLALGPEAAEFVTEDPGAAQGELESELPEDDLGLEAAAPTVTAGFPGIPQTQFQPPDCTVGVGPHQVLASVNSDIAAYTKAGAQIFRVPLGTLFAPVLPAGQVQIFDPRVAYDHYAGRFVVVAAARRANPAGSWLMVGVSQGASAAGPYWLWALDARLDGSTLTNNWADYPMLGFDTQALYISSNMFQIGGGFQYAKLRILNKAEVYAGGVGPGHFIRWYDLWNLRQPDNTIAFTVQPAAHFRGVGGNPPAYLVNAIWPGGNRLVMWTLGNPIAHWSGGAPALARVWVPCMQYELPPDAMQQGNATRIETNDARLLNAIYQNAGGVQRLWTCHTTRHTWAGEAEARSTVQFYEINVPTQTVQQQNRFGATGLYYYFPAIQTDIQRRAFVVFGRSGANEFAQLRQTGRRVGDPPNTLQGSSLLRAGLAPYTGGRWGDYFGICRDGGNAGMVWMYGQHAAAGNTWGTRVAAVMLPAPLGPGQVPDLRTEMEDIRRSITEAIQSTQPAGERAGKPVRG